VVYQNLIQTILLQQFAHRETSEWFSSAVVFNLSSLMAHFQR